MITSCPVRQKRWPAGNGGSPRKQLWPLLKLIFQAGQEIGLGTVGKEEAMMAPEFPEILPQEMPQTMARGRAGAQSWGKGALACLSY